MEKDKQISIVELLCPAQGKEAIDDMNKKSNMIFYPEHIHQNEGIIIRSDKTQPYLQAVGRMDKLHNPKRYEKEQSQRIEDEKRVIANTEVLFKYYLKNEMDYFYGNPNKRGDSKAMEEKDFWVAFDANLKQMQSKEPISIIGRIFATLKNKLQHCMRYILPPS